MEKMKDVVLASLCDTTSNESQRSLFQITKRNIQEVADNCSMKGNDLKMQCHLFNFEVSCAICNKKRITTEALVPDAASSACDKTALPFNSRLNDGS